jgi:hypothetical protein
MLEQLEQLVHKELQVIKVPLDLLVLQDLLDHKAQQEPLDRLVLLELQDQLVQQA